MSRLVRLASTADIPPETAKMVEVEGKRLAAFDVIGRLYAIDDPCPQSTAPRCPKGELEGEVVACAWHRSMFRVTNGEMKGMRELRRSQMAAGVRDQR